VSQRAPSTSTSSPRPNCSPRCAHATSIGSATRSASRIHRLLFHEAGFSEDDAFAGVRTQLAEFIAAAIANTDFAHADVDLLTDYLLSGIHGALVAALHATDHNAQHYLRGAKELSQRLVQPQA
jgi:hypothetical protein